MSGKPGEGVGPVLIAGDVSRAVVEALRESNPGLDAIDRGSYVRVRAPGGCRLQRSAVERRLGRPFRLPADLEAVMPSFTGRFRVGEEEAAWEAR